MQFHATRRRLGQRWRRRWRRFLIAEELEDRPHDADADDEARATRRMRTTLKSDSREAAHK